MIICLPHAQKETAKRIHAVFQKAYGIEAELIGLLHFPPLDRSIENIQNSGTIFFGVPQKAQLTAVIEISRQKYQLDIDSLVVDPNHFRQGQARLLLTHVLNNLQWKSASVETALANKPAIALYQQLGFTMTDEWHTDEGIRKVLLCKL